jgi:methionyl aminopeptidase
MAIEIKSEAEIAIMREAGSILAQVIDVVIAAVQPGVRESELDDLARSEFARHKVIPTFLDYPSGGAFPYPAVTCISVNDKIVHAIPGKRPIENGDLLSIDFGCTHRGFVADAARSMAVGLSDAKVRLLVDTTREALDAGIAECWPGKRMGDIGHAIQTTAEAQGFSVVREYVGHGVGREMHEAPPVPNFGEPGRGLKLREGMVLALEPMLNIGGWETRRGDDGWAVYTADGSLSAHFEDTVAITDQGPVILTRPPEPALVAASIEAERAPAS